MLEDRNIQLGCGFQTVEGRGVAVVVAPEFQHGQNISEERFTFHAKLCESAEELQKNFSAAMSISLSAYGADLGANASASNTVNTSHFDAYYMMELEFRKSRSTVNTLGEGSEILDDSIWQELNTLDTLEKWEEFYRTKGDHVVNSVTYGHKLIIIVSLSHKVRSDQLRRMVEAKSGFHVPEVAQGQAATQLNTSLNALAEENISSVQIYSIGDNNPNFLKEIDKLAALKSKIRSFVNSMPVKTDEPQKPIDHHESKDPAYEKPEGVIIAYSTCSYIDFLNKKNAQTKKVEAAYDHMLRQTNRASLYLEDVTRCYGRLDVLMHNLDFFLDGHDGAFKLDATLEASAHMMQDLLRNHKSNLRGIARDVVAEVSGLSEDGRRRRHIMSEARECLGLLDEVEAHSMLDLDSDEFQDLCHAKSELIDKFSLMLQTYSDAGDLKLKERLQALLEFIEQTKIAHQTFLKSLNMLLIDVSQKIEPLLHDHIHKMDILLKQSHALYDILQIDPLSSKANNSFLKYQSDLKKFIDECPNNKIKINPLLNKISVLYDQEKFLESPTYAEQLILEIESILEVTQSWGDILDESVENRTILLHLNNILNLTQCFTHPEAEALYQNALALKNQFGLNSKKTSKLGLAVLEQYRLNARERLLLQKHCDKYIQTIVEAESSEEWWKSRWVKILNISRDLDCIISNRLPPNTPIEAISIFGAIDFEFGAFLVSILKANRGRYFNKDQFNGSRYENMMIPSETLFLRFKAEAANCPKIQVEFHIAGKSKRLFEGHESAHRKLYRSIKTKDPIYPVRPNMREVAALLETKGKPASLARGEALMHSLNETRLHRKIKITNARILGQPWSGNEIRIRVFAQMKQRLFSLNLPELAPRGISDYGVRFKIIGSTELPMTTTRRREPSSATPQTPRQVSPATTLLPKLLRPSASFVDLESPQKKTSHHSATVIQRQFLLFKEKKSRRHNAANATPPSSPLKSVSLRPQSPRDDQS